MNFYRFPAMAMLKRWTRPQQHRKIAIELEEAKDAWLFQNEYRELKNETDTVNWRHNYGMELMDIIHATETALRMEFTDEEVAKLREDVIEKNRKRGYYDALHQSL